MFYGVDLLKSILFVFFVNVVIVVVKLVVVIIIGLGVMMVEFIYFFVDVGN